MKARFWDLHEQTLVGQREGDDLCNWHLSYLEKQCHIASMRHMPVSMSMILVRLGNLDAVIEQQNWQFLDSQLTAITKLISDTLPSSYDLVVRCSRDTFICILPDAGPKAARHAALMLMLHAKHMKTHNTICKLKCAGVTKWEGRFNASDLLHQAQESLSQIDDGLNFLKTEYICSPSRTQLLSGATH